MGTEFGNQLDEIFGSGIRASEDELRVELTTLRTELAEKDARLEVAEVFARFVFLKTQPSVIWSRADFDTLHEEAKAFLTPAQPSDKVLVDKSLDQIESDVRHMCGGTIPDMVLVRREDLLPLYRLWVERNDCHCKVCQDIKDRLKAALDQGQEIPEGER